MRGPRMYELDHIAGLVAAANSISLRTSTFSPRARILLVVPSTALDPLLAHEAPPPRALIALIRVITMLPETVPGLSDKGRHVQFEKKSRRVERRMLPRRGRSAHPTCHSPHKHTLAINVLGSCACPYRKTGSHPGSSPGQAFSGTCANNARDGVTQSLPNPCGRLSPPSPVSRYVNVRRPGVRDPAPIPPLRMLLIISWQGIASGAGLNVQFRRRR